MKNNGWLKTGLILMSAVGLASAHLSTAGLKPAAGETLTNGDSYSITWTETANHAKGTDISISINGGTSFTLIKPMVNDQQGTNTYKWTVEANATTMAKIRICQYADPGGMACTDANNTSNPTSGSGGHYVLVTDAFTIAAAPTNVRSVPSVFESFSMDFRPETGNVDVSFGLASEQMVSLQVFDAQGHLIANLLDGKQSAGSHRMSLFANAISTTSGMLVFKLNAGGEVRTHVWNLMR